MDNPKQYLCSSMDFEIHKSNEPNIGKGITYKPDDLDVSGV